MYNGNMPRPGGPCRNSPLYYWGHGLWVVVASWMSSPIIARNSLFWTKDYSRFRPGVLLLCDGWQKTHDAPALEDILKLAFR